MSTWIQLTSINPPGPVWVNLDSGYYMNAVATGSQPVRLFTSGAPRSARRSRSRNRRAKFLMRRQAFARRQTPERSVAIRARTIVARVRF